MQFFLDTEFTNLPWVARSELLWIALVDETGTREFSAINDDCELEACSPFVRQHVVPKLGGARIRLPRGELAQALTGFVSVTSNPQFWSWNPSVLDIAALADSERAPELHDQFADWDYQLTLALFDQTPPEWPAECNDLHALADSARIQLPLNYNPHDPLSDAHWGRGVWSRVQNSRG